MNNKFEPVCPVCGGAMGGRVVRAAGRLVHLDCLEWLREPRLLLDFMRDHPAVLLDFLDDHLCDDFLADLWAVFRDEEQQAVERWAVE